MGCKASKSVKNTVKPENLKQIISERESKSEATSKGGEKEN